MNAVPPLRWLGVRHLRIAAAASVALLVAAIGLGVATKREERSLRIGVNAAGRKLKGKGTAALPFDYIISYGAVDIDRKYATVWLMLGRDAERLLPPWTGFRNGSAQPEQSTSDGYKPVPLDDATLKAIDAMRGVVDAEVRKAGWTGTLPWVGFESTARVDRAGGPYRYFK